MKTSYLSARNKKFVKLNVFTLKQSVSQPWRYNSLCYHKGFVYLLCHLSEKGLTCTRAGFEGKCAL